MEDKEGEGGLGTRRHRPPDGQGARSLSGPGQDLTGKGSQKTSSPRAAVTWGSCPFNGTQLGATWRGLVCTENLG